MESLLSNMHVNPDSTLKDALVLLDKNAQGVIFITDYNNIFVGLITDGDIRRALLKGYDLHSQVGEICNREAFTLPYDADVKLIQKHLSGKVRHIPLLDSGGKLVDYASLNRVHRTPILEPALSGNELKYVTECIETNWISSQGGFVSRFEQQLADYCNVPHALAVSNGTVALHLSLVALGIGEGDEVLVPDFTFAATINSIIHAGATPVLVDIAPSTWTINPEKIEEKITQKTKAIMPVHIYGHPCHMDQIMAIAEQYSLYVIEDCAEALGTTYRGIQVGSFGDAATFSFFGNKIVTTGEGGMILFKDQALYEKATVLRDHGMTKGRRYWHDVVGYNYRITNLQAAVGVAQMEQIDKFRLKREENSELYSQLLGEVEWLQLQPLQDWAESSYWLYTIVLNDALPIARDELIRKFQLNGIETRPTFNGMHMMPVYHDYAKGDVFPVSERLSKQGISLPSSVTLMQGEVEFICKILVDFVSNATLASAK